MDFLKACNAINEAETALERAKRHKDERKMKGYHAVLSRVNTDFDAMLPSGITSEQRKMILGTLGTMNSVEELSEKFMNCAHALDKLLPGFSEPFEQQIEDKRKSHEEWQARMAVTRAREEATKKEEEAKRQEEAKQQADSQPVVNANDVEEFGQAMAELIAKLIADDQKKGRPQTEIDYVIEKLRESQRARVVRRSNAILQSDIDEFGQAQAERIAKWVIDEQDKGRPQTGIDDAVENHRKKLRREAVLQPDDVEKFGQTNAKHIADWILSQRGKGIEETSINATVEKYRKALSNNGYSKDDACNELDYDIVKSSEHYYSTAQVIGTGDKDAFWRFALGAADQYKSFMQPLYINHFLLKPARDLCKMRAKISKAKMQELCSVLKDLANEYKSKVENALFASKKEERMRAVTEKMNNAFHAAFNDPEITEENYTDLCDIICYAAREYKDDKLENWLYLSCSAGGYKLPVFSMLGTDQLSSYYAGSKPDYRSHYQYRYVDICLDSARTVSLIRSAFRDSKKEDIRLTDLPSKYRTYEDYVGAFRKEAEMLADCVEYNYCQSMFIQKEQSSRYHRLVTDLKEYAESTNDARYDADSYALDTIEFHWGMLRYCDSKKPQDYHALFDALDLVKYTKNRYDRLLAEEMSRITGVINNYNERTEATISGMGWGMGGGLIGGIIGGGLARYNYRQEFLIHKWDSEIYKQAAENLKRSGISQWPD